jgi:hypothetical protein
MGLNLDELRKDFDNMSHRQSGTFIPPDGDSIIRILPSWDPLFPNRFYKKVGKHNIFGEKYFCPKDTTEQPCPLCEQRYRLYKSAKFRPEDATLAKELKSIQRFYWNVIVRGQEQKGVQKFECGSKLADKIMNIILNELKRDITDPEQGHDLVVNRRMNGEYPDYTNSYIIIQPSPLGNPEWLDHLHNFDKEFVPKSYDELRDVLERSFGPTVAIAPPSMVTMTPPISTVTGQPPIQPPPVQQPTVQPPVQPTVQPPVQPTVQPPVQPAPVQQPVAQPPVQPVAQPPVQPVAQPPVQPVAQPVVATEPVPPVQPVPNSGVTAEEILNMLTVPQK